MKIIKSLNLAVLFMAFSFLIVSCGDDDNVEVKTIAETAVETEQLSILVEALERADLVSVLDGTTNFTVFAPTNEAFNNFLTQNGLNSLDDIPTDVLTQVLLNHVVTGTQISSTLNTGYYTTNATEASTGNAINMYINTSNGVTINGSASVTTVDINASNGVVHLVDSVIALPTVVDFAVADSNFSVLVQALTRSDLPTNFVSVLSSEGPFTVFAPTNEAFVDLLTELGITGLEDIDAATLDAVLKYHVAGNANVLSSMLSDDMSVMTLADEGFTVDLDNGAEIIDNNNRRVEIFITDVQASNGVIHVINKVLLP